VTTDDGTPAVAPSGPAPGAVIAGRYRLEARLGSGGGGTVWRCRDDALGATVALKIVAAGGDVERWRREVAMARRIADRNVCRVHDLGETGEHRFVTMELVEGAALRRWIRGDVPAAEAGALFAQVVSGAAAIHAAGVVHRDLKPENIVVARDGRAVIVDFGLAREPQQPTSAATMNLKIGTGERAPAPGATVTNAGVAVGTPRYMSPEQAAGDAVDARTDVWALGLIGHELLTGALPVPDALGRRIDPSVEARLPGAAAVLARCLAVDPDQRYADARALHAALSGLGGAGAGAGPPPARAPGGRAGRRRLALAVAAAGLAAVAGAAVLATRTAAPPTAGSAAPATGSAAPATPLARGSGTAAAAGSVAAGPAIARPAPRHRTDELELFPIVTEPRRWPSEAPISVAVARDGKRFAYTTAGGDLLVQPLAPGAAPDKWVAPRHQRPGSAYREGLAMLWCVGWFGDGSLAVIGSTYRDGYQLYRVRRDGSAVLLHSQAAWFAAAVASDDRVAFAIDGDAVFVLGPGDDPQPDQILPLAPGERVLAIAAAPDAPALALARLAAAPGAPVRIQTIAPGDAAPRELWSGASAAARDTLLVWLDDGELAFSRREPGGGATTVYTLDPAAPGELHARGSGAGYGAGSAAAGTVLMLRTGEQASVQIGDARGEDLAPVVANVASSRIAGWLPDGRLVFALGDAAPRVVRALPGRGAEPWPGTRDGVELPDTVVGDSVIVHRLDRAAAADRGVIVERIDPSGRRTELARLPADRIDDAPVRCAGDRAAPCVLHEVTGGDARWVEIQPRTGARGRVLHSRGAGGGAYRDGALSPDGRTLAIVEGTAELVVIGDPGGAAKTYPAGGDAALHSVAFAPGGDIWAASIGFHGRPFGLMAFEYRAKWHSYSSAYARGSPYRDVLRRFSRPTLSPDGTRLAVAVRELHPEVLRVQGL